MDAGLPDHPGTRPQHWLWTQGLPILQAYQLRWWAGQGLALSAVTVLATSSVHWFGALLPHTWSVPRRSANPCPMGLTALDFLISEMLQIKQQMKDFRWDRGEKTRPAAAFLAMSKEYGKVRGSRRQDFR